ncbi:hypothetical protein CI610_01605 [invertebrate metagenome]|uniref:Transposase IS30-like HTH domain-containing protein n=1 Tax=invertebrate metagenome TaxID=1711999 RepID=A0A2H9T845_9ZZZZ
MSTQIRQYNQLTQGQRYPIEVLLGKGLTQIEIAETVGVSESALSRELQRNTSKKGYCAESAHSLAVKRRKSACKHSKTDERQTPIIEKGLLLGWSPENISCRMKIEVPEIALSHSSIYNRIADDKGRGGAFPAGRLGG